jgi:hypothetical protein
MSHLGVASTNKILHRTNLRGFEINLVETRKFFKTALNVTR